ncbi:hypothetical protein A1O3_03679 [Capronia epimyces CBS 606.96]|uniref:Cytidyltransferase-like domain-containing protein n=1 Tax=Capronia epimyces CBS 606.96 TaxID=1182542 RepID=W9YBT7_9EURO|nr:uncharacterized protein A1O3_03679 [Capronia epimyces CBS 606.96]EXJ86726.1 hypothetical protein A1O3_03679 [Capronia epimyces CBS 606.96]
MALEAFHFAGVPITYPLNRTTINHNTAPLGSYIEKAYYGDSNPFNEAIFDQGITHRPPQLESDRTNRILLYPGSFNPPHVGHWALLDHALASSQDINIIAAIILPLDDDRVIEKCEALGQSLAFSKEQRVQIWRGYGPHDKYWAYGGSEGEWPSFRHRLNEDCARDGFEVKFIVLAGPDQVSQDDVSWNPRDCEEILVSDVSRSADFTTSEGTLEQFEECDPWEPVFWNEEAATRHATSSAAFLGDPRYFEHLMETLRSDDMSKTESVSICYRKAVPTHSIRFIPAQGEIVHISSTLIRTIIEECEPARLEEELKDIALHPEILVEFVRAQVPRHGGCLRASISTPISYRTHAD